MLCAALKNHIGKVLTHNSQKSGNKPVSFQGSYIQRSGGAGHYRRSMAAQIVDNSKGSEYATPWPFN